MSEFRPDTENPGTFPGINAVLQYRPPMPIDRADYSGLFTELRPSEMGEDALEPGYSWEGMPRWVSEIEEVFNRTEGVWLRVDAGSSNRGFIQQEIGEGLRRAHELAGKLEWELFSDDWLLRHPIEDPDLLNIHHAAARDKAARELVRSAAMAVIFTLTPHDLADYDREVALPRLTDRFTEVLTGQQKVIQRQQGGHDQETRLGISFRSKEERFPYVKMLGKLKTPTVEALQAGERLKRAQARFETKFAGVEDKREIKAARQALTARHIKLGNIALASKERVLGIGLARKYLDWQAKALASMVAGNKTYRVARYLSMDKADPADIANCSLDRTLPHTRGTHLFSHGIAGLFDPHLHIVADMFEPWPLPDNSVSVITIFDVWPIESSFKGLTPQEIVECISAGVDFLWHLYQKLAYEGKLIVFPWTTADGDERSAEILRQVQRRLTVLTGHGYHNYGIHPVALQVLLSPTERVTADLFSSVFARSDLDLEALIISKPPKDLVEVHARDRRNREIRSLQSVTDFHLWGRKILDTYSSEEERLAFIARALGLEDPTA